MKQLKDILSLKKLIIGVYNLRKDLDFALTEIDQLTSTLIAMEDDIKLIPDLLHTLAERNSAAINKIEALESDLIAREVIKKDYRKKVLN